MITKKAVQTLLNKRQTQKRDKVNKHVITFLNMLGRDVESGRLINDDMLYQHIAPSCPEAQRLIIKALKREGFTAKVEEREISTSTKGRRSGKVTKYNKTIFIITVDLLGR